jgi:hypothetical protein
MPDFNFRARSKYHGIPAVLNGPDKVIIIFYGQIVAKVCQKGQARPSFIWSHCMWRSMIGPGLL